LLLQELWEVSVLSTRNANAELASPIKSSSPIMGDKIVLKLGVFPKVPEPEWEAFAVRRQDWEVPVEGCLQYKLVGGPGKEQLK
jgi:hypothetical protein